MRAPDFWMRDDWRSRVIAPLGWLYGASVAWKARGAAPYRSDAAVICVGNLSVGGTGKTPVAIEIARLLIERGQHPFFLSRGYGGKLRGPLEITSDHHASEVGDEPLLLAHTAPVIVSRDRRAGAILAVEHGADVIVMDDGHQNFALAKDLSLVVVDGEAGFGNGYVIPAGPLREPIAQGLARADAVIVTGDGAPDLDNFSKPVLRTHLTHPEPDITGRRIVAFAGIGRPDKFFQSLRAQGAILLDTKSYADHHTYTAGEIARLRSKARAHNAELVTTEKDFVRLTPLEREGIRALPVRATFDDSAALERLLDRLPTKA
jgi:tetraacyldisaccharide 4'-kinase